MQAVATTAELADLTHDLHANAEGFPVAPGRVPQIGQGRKSPPVRSRAGLQDAFLHSTPAFIPGCHEAKDYAGSSHSRHMPARSTSWQASLRLAKGPTRRRGGRARTSRCVPVCGAPRLH